MAIPLTRWRTKRVGASDVDDLRTGTDAAVRRVLSEYAGLPVDAAELDETADLRAAGMSSHATVNVMIELEDRFGVEFPAEMLTPRAFENVAAITSAVEELRRANGAASDDLRTEARRGPAPAHRSLPRRSPASS